MVARSSTAGSDPFILTYNTLYSYKDYWNSYTIDISNISYWEAMLAAYEWSIKEIWKNITWTLDEWTISIWDYTLIDMWITWWAADDWLNWEQWAIFIK